MLVRDVKEVERDFKKKHKQSISAEYPPCCDQVCRSPELLLSHEIVRTAPPLLRSPLCTRDLAHTAPTPRAAAALLIRVEI